MASGYDVHHLFYHKSLVGGYLFNQLDISFRRVRQHLPEKLVIEILFLLFEGVEFLGLAQTVSQTLNTGRFGLLQLPISSSIPRSPDNKLFELHLVAGERPSFIRQNELNLAQLLIQTHGIRLHSPVGNIAVHLGIRLHKVPLEHFDELQANNEGYGDECVVEDEIGEEGDTGLC